MRKNFTPEQMLHTVRQAESGTPVTEVCRKIGITEQTFYKWKRRLVGMGIAELARLRQLEDENKKLKSLVADLTLDKHMLAEFLCGSFQISERHACRVLHLQRSVYYYRSRADPQTELRIGLKELAAARVRYGYERLHTLLVREGGQINIKRVYRLYHE